VMTDTNADVDTGLNGWERVERSISEARRQLEQAATEEQFQAVGLLCRETLISLAQIVYDPALHSSPDGVPPGKTDAKRMLEAYLVSALGGGANEVARRYARASLDLANELQHKRTANYRDAALCLGATVSLVDLASLVYGHTDRTASPDLQVEFSHRGIRYGSQEHLYPLEVAIMNNSSQTINDLKLELAFPDLDSIPRRWIGRGVESESGGRLVEVEPKDERVEVSREGYVVRITFRLRDKLFPHDRLDLGEAIGLRYRIDASIFENMGDMPPLHWKLFAENMLPKKGQVSLDGLSNY